MVYLGQVGGEMLMVQADSNRVSGAGLRVEMMLII